MALQHLPSTIDKYTSLSKPLQKKISDYVCSSLTIGRHLDRAVILTLGVSGQGKSKTMNTLVGKYIFPVHEGNQGSITKVFKYHVIAVYKILIVSRSCKGLQCSQLTLRLGSVFRCPSTTLQASMTQTSKIEHNWRLLLRNTVEYIIQEYLIFTSHIYRPNFEGRHIRTQFFSPQNGTPLKEVRSLQSEGRYGFWSAQT